MWIGGISRPEPRKKRGVMRQMIPKSDTPLITADAAASSTAPASGNRLERRCIVLPVSAALTVTFVVASYQAKKMSFQY